MCIYVYIFIYWILAQYYHNHTINMSVWTVLCLFQSQIPHPPKPPTAKLVPLTIFRGYSGEGCREKSGLGISFFSAI